VYRQKFLVLPDIIREWVAEHRSLDGASILDFGCGEATTALGMSLRFRPRRVVGVDIMADPDRCLPAAREQLGLEALPPNLALHRVARGALHDPRDRFDLIYSWSVLEHVDRRLLPEVLHMLREALTPDGLLFVQVAPLYYSAEGSHLFERIPEPWGHLLNQHDVYYAKLAHAVEDPDERRALWSTYRTLNKLTADELIQATRDAGLHLLRTYTTRDTYEVPPRLPEIFNEAVLCTNQVVLLGHK
jgi:SAM-dependent methyltransferase